MGTGVTLKRIITRFGSSKRTRTSSLSVNSRVLHHWAIEECWPGDHLLSHTVSRAVPSASIGLTFVFGMENGCYPKEHHHQMTCICYQISNNLSTYFWKFLFFQNCTYLIYYIWSSPRSISIGQLNMLPCLHPRPINLVFFKGSY